MTGEGRDRDGPARARASAGPGTAAGRRQDLSGARPEDSVGEYLARQRRLRGISLDELCERTRIPRRNLERLEAGAFDEQRDGFARGFVRTVAAALGLDANEAVMRLMREPAGGEPGPSGNDLRGLSRRLAVAGALLVVLLSLWGLVQVLRGDGEPEPAAEPGLVYRPDVVRQLAEEGAPSSEPAPAPVPPAAPGELPAEAAGSTAPPAPAQLPAPPAP